MASSDDEARTVKVICSHGGRFVRHENQPGEEYVGGTNFLVKLGRYISYPDLLSRLSDLFSLERTADLVLRYEAPGREEILILVSDAGDVVCMMDMFEHHTTKARGPPPRFRLFVDRLVGGWAESSPPLASARTVQVVCSYGGRIEPQTLTYVGGTNRLVRLGRNITYPDLITHISDLFSLERTADLVLKYQFPEQGDHLLISVVDGRDVEFMMQELDCRTFAKAAGPSPLLRLFLDRVGDGTEEGSPPCVDSCDAHHGDSDSDA